ncbi:unnamed protein product [marine sediment metagenome]|uniref:Uncharacterized protein n=1 Tax=marine sediment metagenome TaxID=412755 RepID=X1BZD2_9ZZZZ
MWKVEALKGFFRNIYDQVFTVRKLTKKLCSDPSFVHRVGLDGLPPSQRAFQLRPRVGFVLAMYNTAKSIFAQYPELETDDKLMFLMQSRLCMLPHVQNAQELSTQYLAKLHVATPQWGTLDLKDKFFAVCIVIFAEEEKVNAVNPLFATDEFVQLVSRGVIQEILNAVFRELHLGS